VGAYGWEARWEAPRGSEWRCTKCGKRSTNRALGEGYHARGWDASCFLNAELVRESTDEREQK